MSVFECEAQRMNLPSVKTVRKTWTPHPEEDFRVIVQNIGFIMKPGAFFTDNQSTFVQIH